MAAELSLKDIEKKLNDKFDSGERLIFWYDIEGSFEDSVDEMELHDAKVHHLTDSNALRTKILLEHDDPNGRYLVYAPFDKPEASRNHLEDTLLYSTQFYADRMSLIASEINLPDRMRDRLRSIASFFGVGVKMDTKKARRESEKRAADFVERASEINLQAETDVVVPVIAMCVLADARNTTFEDLIYSVYSHDGLEDDTIISEFRKFGLDSSFWDICKMRYGYDEKDPNLVKMIRALFATYISRDLSGNIPANWKPFILPEKTNINVLLDNMMNSVLYSETFDTLSSYTGKLLDLDKVLAKSPLEGLLYSSASTAIDEKIIRWAVDRLLDENRLAAIDGKTIDEICEIRSKLHFGRFYKWQYEALDAAYRMLFALDYTPRNTLRELTESYCKRDYKIDQAYRHFIYAYDKLEDSAAFDELKDRILNIYQTEYLEKIVYAWNSVYVEESNERIIPWQKDFYYSNIKYLKEKVAVIISDAFRYETAQELVERLEADQNCEVSFSAMMGTLPSYTQLGMAELLPHGEITMTDTYDVLADGCSTTGTVAREKLLQSENPASSAIVFDAISGMKTDDIRKLSAGKEVIYIYHNKIDAKGESQTTENYVFDACKESIDDIFKLIKTLSKSGNIYRFYVTADHGFIYNRKPNTESDKLSHSASKMAFKDRRFIIDDQDLSTDGVYAVKLGDALGCNDDRYIMLAKGMSVFKTGGGMNYVHGGSSPQELLIPNIFVKTKKGYVETEDAKLILVTGINKVTNLRVPLDFLQEVPVSDTVKAANYRIFFAAEDDELISNEIQYAADKKSEDPRDRMFRLVFDIKRKSYDYSKKYYLKIVNAKTGQEILSRQVGIDLPFTDNFGF